ncbi:MAG: hypothetical protein ACREEE_15365 [Dongiaceae bacterium]
MPTIENSTSAGTPEATQIARLQSIVRRSSPAPPDTVVVVISPP